MMLLSKAMKILLGFLGVLILLAPLTVLAQNKVVVIPLFGDDAKPLKNIVTVAKANGMFTDPVAAVNSITDASETNPYLVVIGPGVYTITETLVMKPHVDITGSGENATKITGAISTDSFDASSSIISGASNSALTSLSVENKGGGYCSIAVFNSFNSPNMNNVTATASNGEFNLGILNSNAHPVMTNVTAWGSGGTNSYGIHNIGSVPTMTNVTAWGSEGERGYGVYNHLSYPEMTNVTAKGYGISSGYGIFNLSSSPGIRRCTLQGNTSGMSSEGYTTRVSQSTIIGGVSGPGTKTCVACDNGNGQALDGNCQIIP